MSEQVKEGTACVGTSATGTISETLESLKGHRDRYRALYEAVARLQPKRLFLTEPEGQERAPGAEELSASELLLAEKFLALAMSDWRWVGIEEYQDHRAEMAKDGVHCPDDVAVPKDEVYRLLWSMWAAGWNQAKANEELGLPRMEKAKETRGQDYTDAVLRATKKARERDVLASKLAALSDAVAPLLAAAEARWVATGTTDEAWKIVRQRLDEGAAAIG